MGVFGWKSSQGLVLELLGKRVCFMFYEEQTLLIFIKDRTGFFQVIDYEKVNISIH